MHLSSENQGRRRFLSRVIGTIQAAIAGTLGVILGGAVTSPIFGRQEENWLPAGTLSSLPDNQPTAVTLRVARQDGYTQVVDRRTVFLVKTGAAEITALDSTCTHLGCRVSWDASQEQLICPCHGGKYDKSGAVTEGPPPAPLARLTTRVDNDQVMVQV